jgi:hypothetical protein
MNQGHSGHSHCTSNKDTHKKQRIAISIRDNFTIALIEVHMDKQKIGTPHVHAGVP